MLRPTLTMLATLSLSTATLAQEARQLDAHEHGVGELNIAVDGEQVAIELHAPGADIVGFEYEATSDEDRAAIEAAVAVLARPLDLFVIPAEAKCTVISASAELESEEEHDDHDEHDHDEHAEGEKHDDHDHDHDEHAKGEKHDDHDEHAEGEHDHEEHAEGESHTEFHAEYMLTCAEPSGITRIDFAYFEQFENALELEIQIVSPRGAQAFEVERDAPVLDLSGIL